MSPVQAGGRDIWTNIEAKGDGAWGKEHSDILGYSIYNNICAISTSKRPKKETFRQNKLSILDHSCLGSSHTE
jgi:hypothetical protein